MNTQVEVPDRKSICPNRPRQNMSMSRPHQTERTYVQTFVRSKIFVLSSCLQKSLCPDFCAFKITYDQTFVRSKPKIVRSNFENLCVHVQTIVRSKTHMSKLFCVQKWVGITQRFYNLFISSIDILGVMVVMKCPQQLLKSLHLKQ